MFYGFYNSAVLFSLRSASPVWGVGERLLKFSPRCSSLVILKLNLCREMHEDVHEDVLEFECHLKLDFDVSSCLGIPYKYCVYKTDHDDQFEHLYRAPESKHISRNRYLNFEVNYRHGKGKILFQDQCHT